MWATAGDKEEQLQKANKIMKNGFMGIAIVFGFIVVFSIIVSLFGVNIYDFSFLDNILD